MIQQTSIDPSTLRLDLPDPERDDLSNIDFIERLENAWSICEQFDLQTEIWRGRILRVVRDREKIGGDGRGTGFLQWLREIVIVVLIVIKNFLLASSAPNLSVIHSHFQFCKDIVYHTSFLNRLCPLVNSNYYC